MDVSAASSTQQMQMRNMDGSGSGKGQGGGMRDIMQSLSSEDQATMKDSLSSMSEEERMSTVMQMKEVDSSTLSAEEYTQTLLDILNKDNTDESEVNSFSVYA